MLLFNIQRLGLHVKLVWVPAHVGVQGNELADRYAKKALKHDTLTATTKMSKAETKTLIKQEIKNIWQKRWNNERKGRDVFFINPSVGGLRQGGRNRREEVILSRLRLGHTGLSKTLFVIGKHRNGECSVCKEEESVKHIFMKCKKYEREREKLKRNIEEIEMEFSIKEMLDKPSTDRIMSRVFEYLRSTGLDKRV